MNKRDLERCKCELARIKTTFGRTVVGVAVVNPDCPAHGLPEERWPARHPLRRHVKLLDLEAGGAVTREEARELLGIPLDRTMEREEWWAYCRRFREERPREVEARLLAEMGTVGRSRRRRARLRR